MGGAVALSDDPAVLMEVLCRMGYMLHVEKLTRDFAAGEVFALLEDEGTDLGELSVDDACAAWEDLLVDGRGILMCVEQNPGTLYRTILWILTHSPRTAEIYLYCK